MTTRYHVTRSIAAPAERVWALLADAGAYKGWNRAVVRIEGEIATGGTIKLVSIVDPERTFKLKVATKDPPRRMEWAQGMPLGLFRGVRTYRLEPHGPGTDFSITEEFTGPLASMIAKSIPDLTDSFNVFADGLKAAAEEAKA